MILGSMDVSEPKEERELKRKAEADSADEKSHKVTVTKNEPVELNKNEIVDGIEKTSTVDGESAEFKESIDKRSDTASAEKLEKANGKGKAKLLSTMADKYGSLEDEVGDDEEDDDDDDQEEDEEEEDDDDASDLLREEDLDFVKDIKNPGSRTRRKVIDFKKTLQELKREERVKAGKDADAEDDDEQDEDDDDDEDDGEYHPQE